MILITWVLVAVTALWLYFRRRYSRFTSRGVKHLPVVPLLGHMLPIMMKKHHVAYHIDMMYHKFANERFIGRYEFVSPTIVIKDLKLIKKITIKDFEHFIDHKDFTDATLDPLFGRNLFSLTGHEWKQMRSFLSPAFTSSKIRHMMPMIEKVAKQMTEALKSDLKESESSYIEVDCKDLTTRSTNDVIASCAFGLKTDSYKEPNNPFYIVAKNITSFELRHFILFFTYASFPALFRLLKLTLLTKETVQFYKDLVLNTMKDREVRNILRPDMIHLLMEAKKGTLKNDDKNVIKDFGFATVDESTLANKTEFRAWSDVDLVAQAVIFLVAGFETVSSALTSALYELANNKDVQDKLAEEIKEFDAKNNGKMDFETVSSMNYMDMVVSEVLRVWPPLTILDRICVKPYNLGKPNKDASDDFTVNKGEVVVIPVWSLHHDPNYFRDPEKFDPERFSEENRPSRFALCELKVLLYLIIKEFEICPSPRTVYPERLSAGSFHNRFDSGHWVRFNIRS
ncbi:cytochrome P450 9e2-like isoform X2 [Bicyclus anynana]|uniref:unspecific monooxygenase n=1 Tax=Bicyclus anynana TaxID=110368 RepID=A0ABM3LMY2_BICAN|nr:cytochrome P450 9e2-like isoform X2 [Bicyclus anynana]